MIALSVLCSIAQLSNRLNIDTHMWFNMLNKCTCHCIASPNVTSKYSGFLCCYFSFHENMFSVPTNAFITTRKDGSLARVYLPALGHAGDCSNAQSGVSVGSP